jgi:transposase-like protein
LRGGGGRVATRDLAERLVADAKAEGIALTGPGGLLSRLTKRVLEAGLEAGMTEHLGYAKHDPAGRDGGNSRNGTRAKTLLTDVGPVPARRAP